MEEGIAIQEEVLMEEIQGGMEEIQGRQVLAVLQTLKAHVRQGVGQQYGVEWRQLDLQQLVF